MTRITRILVPTDFSPTADARAGSCLGPMPNGSAQRTKSRTSSTSWRRGLERRAPYRDVAPTRTVPPWRRRTRGAPTRCERRLFGHVRPRTIAEYAADRNADLIVMGALDGVRASAARQRG